MWNRLRGWIVGHKVASVITVLVLVGGGYYAYRTFAPKSTATTYSLAAVSRGALISSVIGSGQVSALDQLNVQSRVSADALIDGPTIGQAVKAGQVLMRLDATDALKAVRDAESSYQSAQLSLEKLQQPATELEITQANNSLNQAQRSETQAEANYVQIQSNAEQTTQKAYDDGYNSASDAFLDMPNHMKDLRDLRGTDANTDANVSAFKGILGSDSPLIAAWLRDHDAAIAIYNENFAFFKTVPRTSEEAALSDLIGRTLDTELAVSQALQSAHAMLDAVVNGSYSGYTIASTVDTMRPKITSDISQINGDISVTQSAHDTLVATKRDTPINLKKAQDSIDAAKESLRQAQQSLDKLLAGADPLDVKSSQLTLNQRQNALTDAQQKLAYYVIRAPFDGTVAASSIRKGDAVGSGSTVVTLVTAKRLATITLNEVDAVKVAVGQKATLTFDAIEDLSIAGEVSSVDVLGTVSQGVVNYSARIQFDSQDARVKPGMSVSAAVVTDIRPDVLLVPSSAVKTSGGNSYVQVFEGDAYANQRSVTTEAKPTSVAVQVGSSNDTQTEIASGLTEGQMVVTKTTTAGAATTSSQTTNNRGGFGIMGIGGGPIGR